MNPDKNMIVHDKRVKGSLTNQFANNIHVLDAGDELVKTVNWIRDLSKERKGLEDLYIICHGIAKEEPLPDGSVKYTAGYGLMIGDKNILPQAESIKILEVWKDAIIGRIILKACGAAYGTWGKKFCNDISKATGKKVVASDTIQGYGLRYQLDPSDDTQAAYYNYGEPMPGYSKPKGGEVKAMKKSCKYYTIEDKGWQGKVFEFNGTNDAGLDVSIRENAVGSQLGGVIVTPRPLENKWCSIPTID